MMSHMMTDATPTAQIKTDEASTNAAQAAHNKQHKTLFTAPVVDVLGAVGSIAAGSVTAWQMIERDFHNNFSTLQLTRDLKYPRDKWGAEHVRKLLEKDGVAPLNTTESARLIIEQSKKYQSDLSQRKAAAGFKTFLDRTKLIHNVQWGAIAITSLAVTSVAIGSLLLLTKDLFKSKAAKPEQANKDASTNSFVEAEKQRDHTIETPAMLAR